MHKMDASEVNKSGQTRCAEMEKMEETEKERNERMKNQTRQIEEGKNKREEKGRVKERGGMERNKTAPMNNNR